MTHIIQLLFADPSSSKWSLLLSRSTFLWTYEYIDYSSSLLACLSSFWIHDIYEVISFSSRDFLEVIAVISKKFFFFLEVTPTFLSRRYSCILTLSSFQSDVRPFFSFDSFVQVSDSMLSRPAISCFFVDREQINLYCSDRPGLQIWNIVVRQMTSVSSCHWSSRKLVETLSRNVLICLMTSLNISEIGDVSTYWGISVLQGVWNWTKSPTYQLSIYPSLLVTEHTECERFIGSCPTERTYQT